MSKLKICFDDGMDVKSNWTVTTILLSRRLNTRAMKYYNKRSNGYEAVCINKIEKGIRSIKMGHRTGDTVGKDLDFFFNKLEEINMAMYEDLYMEYCIARLEAEKKEEIKDIHS